MILVYCTVRVPYIGLDLDFGTPWIRDEIIRWGKWFTDATRADGYRLDAVKHIDAYYQRDWLREMRAHTGREMFSVGEYWSGDLSRLVSFLDKALHLKMATSMLIKPSGN